MKRIAVLATLVALGSAAAVGVSYAAAGSSDTDRPITGAALASASEAALAATGGGQVTETEVGDEDAFYEVEVTLEDGSQVDVHLDQSFDVVGSAPDAEHPSDRDGVER